LGDAQKRKTKRRKDEAEKGIAPEAED